MRKLLKNRLKKPSGVFASYMLGLQHFLIRLFTFEHRNLSHFLNSSLSCSGLRNPVEAEERRGRLLLTDMSGHSCSLCNLHICFYFPPAMWPCCFLPPFPAPCHRLDCLRPEPLNSRKCSLTARSLRICCLSHICQLCLLRRRDELWPLSAHISVTACSRSAKITSYNCSQNWRIWKQH